MSVRTFMGDLTADQAQRLAVVMQAGAIDPDRLVQARDVSGGWTLFETSLGHPGARVLCTAGDRWPPSIAHDPRFDAATWPGKAIEEDNRRMAADAARRAEQTKFQVVSGGKAEEPDPPSNVRPLRDGPTSLNYPVPAVVEMLEKMLEQARRGEIIACAVAFTRPNRAAAVNWEGSTPASLLAGAIALLEHRYHIALAKQIDGYEDGAGPDVG